MASRSIWASPKTTRRMRSTGGGTDPLSKEVTSDLSDFASLSKKTLLLTSRSNAATTGAPRPSGDRPLQSVALGLRHSPSRHLSNNGRIQEKPASPRHPADRFPRRILQLQGAIFGQKINSFLCRLYSIPMGKFFVFTCGCRIRGSIPGWWRIVAATLRQPTPSTRRCCT